METETDVEILPSLRQMEPQLIVTWEEEEEEGTNEELRGDGREREQSQCYCVLATTNMTLRYYSPE